MTTGIKYQTKTRFRCGTNGRKHMEPSDATATPVATGRVPRVSRLMALAIRFDGLIRDGVVADQAELARLGHVSRSRLTQIMNLLCLAPDIQEVILFLPVTEHGRDVVAEKQLRPIAGVPNWRKQRQMAAIRQGLAAAYVPRQPAVAHSPRNPGA